MSTEMCSTPKWFSVPLIGLICKALDVITTRISTQAGPKLTNVQYHPQASVWTSDQTHTHTHCRRRKKKERTDERKKDSFQRIKVAHLHLKRNKQFQATGVLWSSWSLMPFHNHMRPIFPDSLFFPETAPCESEESSLSTCMGSHYMYR